MFSLDPRTWNWDCKKLPKDAQSALLVHPPLSQIRRLTPDLYAFRIASGTGPWSIGTLEEITSILSSLPISEPYQPPRHASAESDPLDFTGLNITIDF
jgi:hypothetical protein